MHWIAFTRRTIYREVSAGRCAIQEKYLAHLELQ